MSEVNAGEEVKVGEVIEYRTSEIGPRRVKNFVMVTSGSSQFMHGDVPPQEPLHSTASGVPQLLVLEHRYTTSPQHMRVSFWWGLSDDTESMYNRKYVGTFVSLSMQVA